MLARLKRRYKVKAPQFCFEGTDMEPMPFVVEEKTTVWLCNCKHTKAKPFCDGSHNDLPDDIF